MEKRIGPEESLVDRCRGRGHIVKDQDLVWWDYDGVLEYGHQFFCSTCQQLFLLAPRTEQERARLLRMIEDDRREESMRRSTFD